MFFFMGRALELAEQAYRMNEIPVGCVIVKDGEIIGEGMNLIEKSKNPTRHAEICAIEQATQRLGCKFLCDCQMYVTLEPCPMCAGAVINSRITELYYGTADYRTGACGGVINLFYEGFGFAPKITGGIMKDKCADILTAFFKQMREKSE